MPGELLEMPSPVLYFSCPGEPLSFPEELEAAPLLMHESAVRLRSTVTAEEELERQEAEDEADYWRVHREADDWRQRTGICKTRQTIGARLACAAAEQSRARRAHLPGVQAVCIRN